MIPKILLVDDVSMFLELQKMFLKLSPVHVITARNGLEAIEVAKKERPELVFMDLHMPGMDGAECCIRLKADTDLKSLPVVMLTSEGKAADRDVCLRAGCDGFLTKPLDRLLYMQTARKFLPALDRRDTRVPCRMNVKFRAFGVTLSGEAINVSANGIYITTDYEIEAGTIVEIVFALPDAKGTLIQAKAKVAWTNSAKRRQNKTLPAGFGVEFTAITEESRGALTHYLQSS